jgi:uncharacterized protein (DUF2461 family)
MKPRVYIFSSLLIALFLTTISLHSEIEPKVSTKDAMRFKLHHAQRVLEGIVTENYEVVADNAKKLKGLSQQADWQIRRTAEYQRLTADFARNADALLQAANNKNVDAATVAYFQMTVSCTTCHKYLRGEKGVGLNQSQEQNAGLMAFQGVRNTK